MIKFSKESKTTFLCLLVIPLAWVGLNYFGYLDYLKTKSLDWRIQARGEIQQFDESRQQDVVQVEGNKSVPRIPKVTYVNFDASTLAMDGVGERPWDRAFFRDTALALIERGNARVLGFDFGFTPKSMSRMVPKENSYRSDAAMGELVEKYPNRVVLGCLYSGVPTSYVRRTGASAFPPFFYDGFSLEDSIRAQKFHYPESPTYPLLSFRDGKYLGRAGSFTVPPFRAVDEIPRWVPLWFPAMGKAHAYNILGGKQSKLEFELPKDNRLEIEELLTRLESLELEKSKSQKALLSATEEISRLRGENELIEKEMSGHTQKQKDLQSLESEIANFQKALEANVVLTQVIKPQLDKRLHKVDLILSAYADDSNSSLRLTYEEVAKKRDRIKQLEEEISNFNNTLSNNPALENLVKPQLTMRVNERERLLLDLNDSRNAEILSLTEKQRNSASAKMRKIISERKAALGKVLSRIATAATGLVDLRSKSDAIDNQINEVETRLSKLRGQAQTILVEGNETLRLVYLSENGEPTEELVPTLPNEVPLNRNRNVFALGVESLLAYYGLDDEAVRISADGTFRILGPNQEKLVECNLEERQFLEVNWFTKWTENLPERVLMKEAKKAYGDGEIATYLKIVPSIFEKFLGRIDGLSVSQDSDFPQIMLDLGLESDLIEVAKSLLSSVPGDEVPSFEQLTGVVEGIAYYFIPPSLQSSTNPMCGMRDVLQNADFQDQVLATIAELEEKIRTLNGPGVMGKIENAIEREPDNEGLIAQKNKVLEALEINRSSLLGQREELARINSFFACFEDAIVLLGPEEKTFQDLAPTPFDKASVPKVGVHGNLIKTMTEGKYITRPPEYVDHVATILVCLVMGLLAVYQGNRASLVQAGGVLLLAGYVFFGFVTFSKTHFLLPVTTPFCAGLSTSFVGLAAMVVIEQKAKGKLKGMFGSYVSSDLVDQMIESGEEPSLGGEETSITAFFSDVQSFSSFSELLTPTGLVDLMNEYLTAMTNILQQERGTLDKYIGDAIVAMYGAPIPMQDHAYQAVKTAILMQQKQIELREKWKYEAEKWGKCHGLVSQMQTRIGCNTGTATVGNMGALDRFNYTMMGDMVNLAARCESGAKAYGAYIMVAEETKLESEKTKGDIAYRYLDKIVVKGRSQPVAMFEPTGFLHELNQDTQDCLDCFQRGIDKYLLQDWDGALNLFEKAKEMEPNKPGVTPGVKDNPSMILIDRCKVMKENPPGDDWDGVYVMTTK